MGLMKCPYLDYRGSELFEGDILLHPSGEIGVIEFHSEYDDPADQWRVDYSIGVLSRLCLQVGDKGKGVKIYEQTNFIL